MKLGQPSNRGRAREREREREGEGGKERSFEREPPLGPSPLAWLGVKPQYKQEASCI
jgi:hypothetical protein